MENVSSLKVIDSEISESVEKRCADLCAACQVSCLEALQECLVQGGELAQAEHIGILQNCADICLTNAQFLLSKSYFSPKLSAICADVCDTCAIECHQYGEIPALQNCATIARQCADSCRRLAAQIAA